MFKVIIVLAFILFMALEYKKRSYFFVLQPQLRVPMAPLGIMSENLNYDDIKEPLYDEVMGMSIKNNLDNE